MYRKLEAAGFGNPIERDNSFLGERVETIIENFNVGSFNLVQAFEHLAEWFA
jgi:hypothetical protein